MKAGERESSNNMTGLMGMLKDKIVHHHHHYHHDHHTAFTDERDAGSYSCVVEVGRRGDLVSIISKVSMIVDSMIVCRLVEYLTYLEYFI